MARLSVFTVVASTVSVCVYISVFLIILELGRGGPERRPAADSVVVISHNFHIAGGVEKLWETAKERVGYDAVRGRLHIGAEAAQAVMEESRRLGRRSMHPKQQQRPCRPSVDMESSATPIKAKIRYEAPISQYQQPRGPRVISLGPWGGHGGEPFRMSGTSVPRLRGITLYHSSSGIHALACHYSFPEDEGDFDKRIRTAGPWGIPNSFVSRRIHNTIDLDIGEYLTAVEGTTGHFGGAAAGGVVITSLTFRTSRGKTYGPYGGSGTGTATPFSLPTASGCIVGFWGRSGRLLDAIGVYVKPCVAKLGYGYPYTETGMKVTVSNKTFVFPGLQ